MPETVQLMGATVATIGQGYASELRPRCKGSRLLISSLFRTGGEIFPLTVLIDTGSEHNLVRPDLIPESFF